VELSHVDVRWTSDSAVATDRFALSMNLIKATLNSRIASSDRTFAA
jgi:hypothetical protein